MRILYFHQHFTTREGSVGTRSYEFAKTLVARGHSVTMICGLNSRSRIVNLIADAQRGWSRGQVDGIDVIAFSVPYSNYDGIWRRAWLFAIFAIRSVQIALRSDYDLLFATSTPLTAALPGIACKLFRRGKPFIFEVRDLWPELPKALGLRNPILLCAMLLLEKLAYKYSDACIGLSPGIVQGIRKRSPIGRKIEMIPNGCDLELFHPREKRVLTFEGIQPNDFVAGFTGTHGVANGLDAVLDVAHELNKRGRINIKLLFIGDGNCKHSLVERARSESLNNCIFLPPIKKSELTNVTASLQCGLQILDDVPSFYYGTSPNKFFDYISAGIPVLVNYPGWVADLVTQHSCGIAVTPNNISAFADALCDMADNSARCQRMGRNARHLAETMFARAEQAEAFCKIIESYGGSK